MVDAFVNVVCTCFQSTLRRTYPSERVDSVLASATVCMGWVHIRQCSSRTYFQSTLRRASERVDSACKCTFLHGLDAHSSMLASCDTPEYPAAHANELIPSRATVLRRLGAFINVRLARTSRVPCGAHARNELIPSLQVPFAWVGCTFVNVSLHVLPEYPAARASERVDSVLQVPPFAWVGCTFVNVRLARTQSTCGARASERVDSVLASATVFAWVGAHSSMFVSQFDPE